MCPPRKSRPACTPRPGQSSAAPERLRGSQAQADPKAYRVWQKTDSAGGPRRQIPRGRFRRSGVAGGPGHQRRLQDPARRHPGAEVRRAQGDADELHHQRHARPQAAVGSGVVRRHDCDRAGVVRRVVAGLRSGRLPARLLLRAAYLLAGWCAGWWTTGCGTRLREHNLDEDALAAESDKSPGVLLASGYIAGGAIAGISSRSCKALPPNSIPASPRGPATNNPFFAGPNADWLALIPFLRWPVSFTSPATDAPGDKDRSTASERSSEPACLRTLRSAPPQTRRSAVR